MPRQAAPPLLATWRWTQLVRRHVGMVTLLTIAADGGRGYLATFTALDDANTPTDPIYWAGQPLTRCATEDEARDHAFRLPADAHWRFPTGVACIGVRLWHQATSGKPYTIHEFYPGIITPPYGL